MKAPLWGPVGMSGAKPAGSCCLRVAAGLAPLVAVWRRWCCMHSSLSPDPLGGINLFECKLDFRWDLLWEVMKTEFSKR